MKKFLLLLAFLLFSCSVTQTYELHKKYYSLGQTEIIKKDVYHQIKKYGADSIPLSEWFYIGTSSDVENTGSRVFSQIEDKSELVFVLTTHETKDSTFYDFSIFSRIKEKKRNLK